MVCTTDFNKNLWMKEHPPCEVKVIPNTISNAFEQFEDGKRAQIRAQYGLAENEFVIGFAGRISEEKDWPFVETLMKVLHEAGLKFKVALVLSVYEEQDAGIVADIKAGIMKYIGEENLIYQQDLSQAQISDYYYMVDAFVMTSVFESFGKAAVEAMSRKCAVLSTTAGGLAEVIGKEENLYTKETLDKFVNRMKLLQNSKEELDSDREFFYKRYKENYTMDVHMQRHIALYDEVSL